MKNLILTAVAGVLVGFAVGYATFHSSVTPLVGAGSPVGTTNNTAKIASVVISPTSLSATSSSILNTDGIDRVVTSSIGVCTSLTLASSSAGLAATTLTFQAATTSVANTGLQGNANYAAYDTVATSTPFGYVASTTPNMTGLAMIWPTNTYLTFLFNELVNTGASCTVAVHYLAL